MTGSPSARSALPRTRVRGTGRALLLGAAALTLSASASAAQAAANPHGPLPRDLDCSACHTAEAWSPLQPEPAFVHGATSGFRLRGAHERAACRSCHLDLRFDEPRTGESDCASCHVDIHEGRQVEPCAACHTTASFLDVDGESIHARTSFPLVGVHGLVPCESCHTDDVGGAFSPLDPECTSCHLDEYRSAATVDHVASGYPTDCTECHSALGWSDAPAFDHAAASGGFALAGAHARLRCESCHMPPDLTPIFAATDPSDCVACHQDDYDREHAGSGFPTGCLSCHAPDTWDGATVDHGSVADGFQLLGRHANASCTSCHAVPGYALLFPPPAGPDDCVTCHQSTFQSAHGGSGFPDACVECHSVEGWTPSTFDHDARYFPIDSGKHRQEWNDCGDCHTSPGDFRVVDCLQCHEHRREKMDDTHKEENGYAYTTAACLTCHPRGNA